MLATSLPVAQWLERPTGVRKVMCLFLVCRPTLMTYTIADLSSEFSSLVTENKTGFDAAKNCLVAEVSHL